jgi:RNA polymerase sigma factor (sigma-70 family)
MPDEKRIINLLERAKQGEHSALDELALEYRDELVAFADSRLGPSLHRELGPEDVAHEALLKAFKALGKFEWRGESSFRQWLFSISEHLIRNALRKRSISLKNLSIDVPGSGDSPSHALRKDERFIRLEQAIKDLMRDAYDTRIKVRLDSDVSAGLVPLQGSRGSNVHSPTREK